MPTFFPSSIRSRPCTQVLCSNSCLCTWKRVCSHQYPASTVLGHRARAPSVNAASLSSAEASLCCGEAGEKEKESARGTMGRGKREERPQAPAFSLFPSSPARFLLFFLLLLFYMDSQWELLWRRETLPLFLNYMGWHRKTNDISSVSVAHIFSTYFWMT